MAFRFLILKRLFLLIITAFYLKNLKQNDVQGVCAESTNKELNSTQVYMYNEGHKQGSAESTKS